jgi:predicted Zn-dependent peptidase
MTRDDLCGHYRCHYVPNNATLVVVGDVGVAEVMRAAERHF